MIPAETYLYTGVYVGVLFMTVLFYILNNIVMSIALRQFKRFLLETKQTSKFEEWKQAQREARRECRMKFSW